MNDPIEFRANYNIKAIPTTYAGVNFRSRLEARWAAFFDLCGWEWEYEPRFDFITGWLPDFMIKTSACHVLAEVKPIDLAQAWSEYRAGKNVSWPDYDKAARYGGNLPIILLGSDPTCLYGDDIIGLIVIDISRALAIAGCTLEEFNNSLRVKGHAGSKWVKADHAVRGIPLRNPVIFPDL